ncbi:actin-like protein 9 [Chelonia mydas]|uniref:actin-like protein 9 n=1 Tax=Chelonia mydas TaxID=8469 RepID=UPI001CA9CAA2|nr:actin-like protein 9 [Chelonia mydas]
MSSDSPRTVSSRLSSPDPMTPRTMNEGRVTSRAMNPQSGSLRTKSPSLRSGAHSPDQYLKAKGTAEESRFARERSSSPVKDRPAVKKTGAVVIETGTGSCKAGFAGQQKPKSIVGTLVGHLSERSIKSGRTGPDTFIGERARVQPNVEIIEPVRNGIIIDWEAAEVLWRHMLYHDLKVPPEEHALLMSDPPLSPTTNREKMVEVVFESLNSPGMYIAYHSVLSVYAHGKISGLVVDAGYAVTHSVPVLEGYNLPHATERMDIAGSDLTSFLLQLLKDTGHAFNERMMHIVEDIKHKFCYVAADFESECNLPKEEYMVDFQLPDGQIISLGKERFQCPERLFNPPNLPGVSLVGIHGMAQRSLKKVPKEARRDMYQNVLLCGGSSLFEGLEKRFSSELLQKVPANTKLRVSSIPLRNYASWTGGSILASLKNFQSCWIRKEQYKEHGPYIVHRKCY